MLRFDLATPDVDGAVEFWKEAGLTFGPGPEGAVRMEAVGSIVAVGPGDAPGWQVAVPGTRDALDAISGAGGRLLFGPVDLPGGAWVAHLVDDQGATLTVDSHPGCCASPARLETPDPQRAAAFYAAVFGWEFREGALWRDETCIAQVTPGEPRWRPTLQAPSAPSGPTPTPAHWLP